MDEKLPNDPPRLAGQGRQVVVADDNRTNLLLLERILQTGGYQATLVSSGEAALEVVFRSDAIAAVLLDIAMPEMDGIEATKLIRLAETGNDEGRMPIIALTADDRKETEASCLDAGADAFLSHPVQASMLLDMIALLIAAHENAATPQGGPVDTSRAIARLAYRGMGERGVKKEMIADLQASGGNELLEQLSTTLRTDSTAAFGYMQLAMVNNDVTAFKEQVMNLYSQTAALGSIGIRSVFAHTTKLEPRQLTTSGPIILERLRYEVETLLEVIARHVTLPKFG